MSHSTKEQVQMIVVMGVCGTGKTTLGALLAGKLGWDFAEADDFHPQSNIDKMSAGTPLTDTDRWPWLRELRNWIDERRNAGKHGIITCSALKRSYRDILRAPGVVFVHLDGSPEAISARLNTRTGHFMPPALLASQLETLEALDMDEDGLKVNLDLGLQPLQEADYVLDELQLAPVEQLSLGMIGLGRMGGNMAQRLSAAGHRVVGYDSAPDSPRDVESLAELVAALPTPRVVWVMVPAGAPTDTTITELSDLLDAGDLLLDGGNTHYVDDQRHAHLLAEKGIGFLDVGTSGGVWGKENGYALMIGGSPSDFKRALPFLETLKPAGESGLIHAGPVGAGHFVKMIHNGIEYGMMQAFGEGYELMQACALVPNPDAVIASWQEGSVIRSWLLDLLVNATKADPNLSSFAPESDESGEAKWMVAAALDHRVPVPVTSASLYARQVSKGHGADTMRTVAALRNQFGGHAFQSIN